MSPERRHDFHYCNSPIINLCHLWWSIHRSGNVSKKRNDLCRVCIGFHQVNFSIEAACHKGRYCLWSITLSPSIKSATRIKRRESGERRVKENMSVPMGRDTWEKFLHNSNKSELYRLLARSPTAEHSLNKDAVATIDETILACNYSGNVRLQDLMPCNHKVADTRVFLHANNAVNNGH